MNRRVEQLGSLVGAKTPAELQLLRGISTPLDLRQGDVLVEEGRESDSVFLVVEGSLRASVSEGNETVELGEIGVNEWIGEVSILSPGPATATVVASSNCRLLKLGRTGFETLAQEDAALADGVIRSLCRVLIERLRATGALVFGDGPHRHSGGPGTGGKPWLLKVYRKLLGIGGESL